MYDSCLAAAAAKATAFLIIENKIAKSTRHIKQTNPQHECNKLRIANGPIRVSITELIIYILIYNFNNLSILKAFALHV